jgi:hypothetical protein
MAVQIEMRGLRGAPIRSDLRELADYQRFDVRLACLLIIKVRANIPDVWISQANNLPGIARVGENFLISGEAGIENDFAAAARNCAGRAAIKYAPVLERQSCGTMQNLGQCALR